MYLCVLLLPALVLFVLNLNNITAFLCACAAEVLGQLFPGIPIYIVETDFEPLGTISMMDLPTVYPEIGFVLLNFLAMLGIILLLCSGKRRGKPLSIYFTLGLLIHMINCIYFIFAPNYFPYTAFDYSGLYMKQQVGIWITFFILSALMVVFMGNKGLIAKTLTFVCIMAYSFVFGAVRYIVFLYMIQKFSILYMAMMFFILGPFFDFLYLVAIYGIFVNKMVKLYDSDKGREEWQWS